MKKVDFAVRGFPEPKGSMLFSLATLGGVMVQTYPHPVNFLMQCWDFFKYTMREPWGLPLEAFV